MIGPLEGDLAFDAEGVEDVGRYSVKDGSVEYLYWLANLRTVLRRYSEDNRSLIFCKHRETIIPGVLM